MRWTLSAMLLGITIIASGLGVYRCFWDPTHPNHPILLGVFLLLTCVAVVAAVFGKATLRGSFFGASLFAASYLIVVLRGGFGLETIYDAEWVARNTKIGFALLGISLLASHLTIMATRPNAAAAKRRIGRQPPPEPANGRDSNRESSPQDW